MSKAFTDAHFSAQITEDRNWRIKEISDLKSAIRRSDAGLQRVLLRSLVAICYAHWEGYVRFSAKKYLEYIARRRLLYRDLDRQFFRNHFLPRLGALAASKANIIDRCALIDEILDPADRRFSQVNDDLINTKANLNSEVFADICRVCGVSAETFGEKSTFIDVVLLKRRNSIAHGEDTMIALSDLNVLSEETIELMRLFGDALENYVVLQTYKAQ